MKLLICGKGGSGKSTVSVLMARAFQRMGKRVLLVDADESNLGLHRLAGSPSAETLLEALPDRIDEIESYDFGRDVVRSERSYDFALVSIFANLDTLKHYARLNIDDLRKTHARTHPRERDT